jgi:hypothetical protein
LTRWLRSNHLSMVCSFALNSPRPEDQRETREDARPPPRDPLGSPGNHRWRCLSYCVYRSLSIDQAKSFGRVDNERRYLIHMRYVDAELISAGNTHETTHLMLQALCMSP